jgi:two-component system sensor histidine kinase BaeS
MKLTSKLIIAFLFVSLLSISIVAIFTRVATNREFDKFINNQYKAELMDELVNYYSEHQTWNGVRESLRRFNQGQFGPGENRPTFYSIADVEGKIIVAGLDHHPYEIVNPRELKNGTPIQVEDKTVGVLLLNTGPDRDPMQAEFLHRINRFIFLSAIGAIIFSLIMGTVLSRTITHPIRELTSATQEIASGKLGQKVLVRSNDEIGELAASFNKMNDDLARSFNLRKQMTADIAHELRTPLSLIIGHAEAVHDGILPASTENFEIIREEANRLEQLVNDLRIVSLADAGELTLNLQPVDINKLLSDIQTLYLHHFNQKRVTLNLKPAPATLRVQATLDPVRITQVLTNILNNALRYTPENGSVDITTSLQNNTVDITIQDSGPGVNYEEAQHLFDRFYRADESRTREEGGSGLGLAIAKSIVEMHNGKIWAESEKGKGLKVIIQLPSSK